MEQSDKFMNNEKTTAKKYYKSQLAYKKNHKTISFSCNLIEYQTLKEFYPSVASMRKALLDIAYQRPVDMDLLEQLTTLRHKYDMLLKTNRILLGVDKEEDEDE